MPASILGPWGHTPSQRLQAGWLVLRGAGGDSGTHGGSSVS